ncbi:MAG: protein jag [Anaerolineae bacterium]|nr:protein jag [Anaerolineae bacterium]
MTQQTTIEISAPDVESAIEQGVAKLGVLREHVMVEVLEEPTKGLLGLGSKLARVKLTVIGVPTPPINELPPAPPKPAAPKRPSRPYADLDEDYEEDGGVPQVSSAEMIEDARIGADVLRNLLDHMRIQASVTPKQSETSEGEAEHWILEITGQDLGLLIGRRGETLASLQYITRLIASRELGRRANIVIDVEGYKARRETMLKRLAKRMADQAVQRGRTVTLEPMPPHERRIIHMTLRDHAGVTTESVGEGDRRKVTIVPRRRSDR